MGLLLICPHCQAKIPLASRACPACGADLRDLPPEDRRYFIGEPAAAEAAPLVPEMIPGPARRPWTRNCWSRYPETMMPDASLPESQDVSLVRGPGPHPQ